MGACKKARMFEIVAAFLLRCSKLSVSNCKNHVKPQAKIRLRSQAIALLDPVKCAWQHKEQIMECTVTWTGAAGTRSGMGFLAETGSGHVIAMDGAPDAVKPENGGQNLAPRPMETLLAGTGGCTAYDVVLILKRGRHDVRGCSVKLTSERAEVDPKVFTKINMHFTVTAKGVPAIAVERAIAMSHDKYCSASIMLGKTAEITTSFDIVEA
jgi:putative redox protein